MLKAAVYGMIGFGIIMAAAVFVPEFGPVINLEWWVYIAGGLVLHVIGKLIKK